MSDPGSPTAPDAPTTQVNPTTRTAQNFPRLTFKLDKIPKLTGPEDYRQWQDSSIYFLGVVNCYRIVTGEEKAPKETYDTDGDINNEDEIDSYTQRYQYASAYFLETVSSDWFIILVTYKTPNGIWQALQDKSARENTVSFFDQLVTLLNHKLDTKHDLATHLTIYESHWNALQNLCSTATATDDFKLPFTFKGIFQSLEAKAALMLYTLPPSMENIVDNPQTKTNITYD